MDRIVEGFDLKEGQIPKVERGNLKLKMVIDWSVSAGLLVYKYYKYFCNYGKHLNIDDK